MQVQYSHSLDAVPGSLALDASDNCQLNREQRLHHDYRAFTCFDLSLEENISRGSVR